MNRTMMLRMVNWMCRCLNWIKVVRMRKMIRELLMEVWLRMSIMLLGLSPNMVMTKNVILIMRVVYR